jgi:LAS superfamily LD-carboxypeptidase LdcB
MTEGATNNPYRVPRDAFGNIAQTDVRLVNIPSQGGNGQQKLHRVCAARFNAMAAAAKAAGIGTLAVASGWRPHLWRNSYTYYCQQMKAQYPTLTCQQAGAKRAFKSPHETGLGFDLGSPSPFTPAFAAETQMRASKGFAWLKANAHLFGITPYKHEPWHWECVITREAWDNGCEFTANYNIRLRETRNDNSKLTSDIGGW